MTEIDWALCPYCLRRVDDFGCSLRDTNGAIMHRPRFVSAGTDVE